MPAVSHFWPGPLTLILPASKKVLPEVCGSGGTIGLRYPKSLFLEGLLRRFGGPITSTSANRAGFPPIQDPLAPMDPMLNRVDYIVDGGKLRGTESTLLDLTGERPRILREGAITREALAAVLPTLL
jgi:L-threonylcarbamoyladenylate synthase